MVLQIVSCVKACTAFLCIDFWKIFIYLWKRPCFWERLKAGVEGDNRG